jgi:ArsR family transcriptional regulator, arsenate/arsenite/antimonite-responsive transcriptional repressor
MTKKTESFDPVAALRALGDSTRWKLFLCLRECCAAATFDDDGGVRPATGLTVGEVCCRITGEEKITSTLSAHLKELRLAGLIETEKRGKHVVCTLHRENLALLIEALKGPETNGCC